MNHGIGGLLALCVLSGSVAFGVLFVAPRYLANEEAPPAREQRAESALPTDVAPAAPAPRDMAEDEPAEETDAAEGSPAPADDAEMASAEDEDRPELVEEAATEAPAEDVPPLTEDLAALPMLPDEADETAAAPAEADIEQGDGGDPMPAFDLLRVEPDGWTVIAGRAEPGRRLEVIDGDEVLASTQVGPDGDFAAIFDEPLAPGNHQLSLRVTGGGGEPVVSDEVATISIPRGGEGELLAMVTRPGEASRIVSQPEPEPEEAVADATPPAADTADAAIAATETEVGPEPADREIEIARGPAGDPIVEADAAGETPLAAAEDAAERAAATPERGAAPRPMPDAPSLAEPGDERNEEEVAEAAPEADASPEIAALDDDVADTPAPREPLQPAVRIDAVEVENDRLFVTGSARPDTTVRVYANDEVLGDDPTSDEGRFLVEGRLPLAVGEHQIRADLIENGDVVARALVPFLRPAGEVAAAVAAPMAPAVPESGTAEAPAADEEIELAAAPAASAPAAASSDPVERPAEPSPRPAETTDAPVDDERQPAEEPAAETPNAQSEPQIAAAPQTPEEAADVPSAAPEAPSGSAASVAPDPGGSADAPATGSGSADPVTAAPTTADDRRDSEDTPPVAAGDEPEPGPTPADTAADDPADASGTVTSREPADEAAVAERSVQAITGDPAEASETAASAEPAEIEAAARPAEIDAAEPDGIETAAAGSDDPLDERDAAAIGDAPAAPAEDDDIVTIEQATLMPTDESVIIRRGDTLWQISRRVYGRGVRYTTIYLANQEQIANPDLILPGQVFTVPDEALDNAEQVHRQLRR